MAVKLGRPILVGGIGLSYGLWLLQSLHHSLIQLGEFGLVGAITIGSCFWLFQQQTFQNAHLPPDTLLDRATVEKVIAQAADAVNHLAAAGGDGEELAQLQERVAKLSAELDRQEVQVAVTGGKAVGKTTLIQVLKSSWVGETPTRSFQLQEAPAFTENGARTTFALAADLVLFLTDGDLTDSELRILQQLGADNQRLVLVFNKQDQYSPEAQAAVLLSLRQRLQSLLGIDNVVAIAASPHPLKVRQHQQNGSVQEWLETPAPDTEQLSQLLAQILVQEGQQLVWASTQRTARRLQAEAKTSLNAVRREQALPVIEQYQWIAAATAFANPVPALDLLATAAINGQLIMDLSKVYQQKFSLQQAQTVAGTLGSLIVKLGLVELSTQTISSILKSNAVTFVAGGAVQGVSAAYLTRIAGLSMVEYFQSQELSTDPDGVSLNLDQLKSMLQRVFQQNQRTAFLQSFIKQAVGRLWPAQQLQPTTNQ